MQAQTVMAVFTVTPRRVGRSLTSARCVHVNSFVTPMTLTRSKEENMQGGAKVTHQVFILTVSYLDPFSEFFHWHNQQ